MRFLERTHKSEGIEKILSRNPIAFFCLISKEDLKSGTPFDRIHFSKMLVKNNILRKKIDSKLSPSIKSTCFLVFPKDGSVPVTSNLMKWANSTGINLLFVKCNVRYYSSLVFSVMDRKGMDSLTIIIKTITNVLGKVSTIVDKINGVICRALKKRTPKTA